MNDKERLEEIQLRISELCGGDWRTEKEKDENTEERVKKRRIKLLMNV